MTWFRIDDSFYDHPKAEDLPDSALALWLRAGSYCSKHLTDGRISYRKARKLCDNPDEAIHALMKVILWEDDPIAEEYIFHDWLDWNPSREQVLAERAKNAARQAAWRERKAAERGAATPPARTPPAPHDSAALFPPPPGGEPPETATRPAPPKLPASHRFDEFWAAYPHKRDKDQARKTWAKLIAASQTPGSDINIDEVIAGAGFYRHSREFQSGHPKFPSTFLTHGSWRDFKDGPPVQPGTDLVAISGGLATAPRGHDAKMGRFAETARRLQERRAAGG